MEIISAIVLIASLILTITTNTNVECRITNEQPKIQKEENNVQETERTDKMPTDI